MFEFFLINHTENDFTQYPFLDTLGQLNRRTGSANSYTYTAGLNGRVNNNDFSNRVMVNFILVNL